MATKRTASAKNPSASASSSRTAGAMLDVRSSMGFGAARAHANTWTIGNYQNSYVNGLSDNITSVFDIPFYFAAMNEKNGGILYFPVNLQEKYEWYRYFYRTQAYVGRSIDLLTDLPISKMNLAMPKLENKNLEQRIKIFFEDQCERLDWFTLAQEISFETDLIGDCFCFLEYDETHKRWDNATILPPEEMSPFKFPLSKKKVIEYRPRMIMDLLLGGGGGTDPELAEQIRRNLPDMAKMIHENHCILFDADPINEDSGQARSFCHHFHRRKSPYHDRGASILERVLIPLMQQENYRYTQLSTATRNMTPKTFVSAVGATVETVNDIRAQIDSSFWDPDWYIVTNVETRVEQIGPQDRLVDYSREYETIENHIFAGMGTTRELLTGETSYSGARLTLEVLNQLFLNKRDEIKEFFEHKIFRPICLEKGWYHDNEDGVRQWYHPKIQFNRLGLRDNAELFDSLFQLYQKNSVPISVIYDVLGLDAETMQDRLLKDAFTVNDATFNELLREVNQGMGAKLIEGSDIMDRFMAYLGLKAQTPAPEDGEEGEPAPAKSAVAPLHLPSMQVLNLPPTSLSKGNQSAEESMEMLMGNLNAAINEGKATPAPTGKQTIKDVAGVKTDTVNMNEIPNPQIPEPEADETDAEPRTPPAKTVRETLPPMEKPVAEPPAPTPAPAAEPPPVNRQALVGGQDQPKIPGTSMKSLAPKKPVQPPQLPSMMNPATGGIDAKLLASRQLVVQRPDIAEDKRQQAAAIPLKKAADIFGDDYSDYTSKAPIFAKNPNNPFN